MGAGWQGDLGSPDDPDEFAALRATSPLHNIQQAERYAFFAVTLGLKLAPSCWTCRRATS